MGRNGYLDRQKATIETYRQVEKDTWMQFMADTITIVLNDPEVMGKDVFGKKRLKRVFDAWGKVYDHYVNAVTADKEADYMQAKLDRKLASIVGVDELIPFSKRYPWVAQKKYSPKK